MGKDLREITGLWLNTGEGIVHTGLREPVENLDSLPLLADVYRRHLKPENYFFAAQVSFRNDDHQQGLPLQVLLLRMAPGSPWRRLPDPLGGQRGR